VSDGAESRAYDGPAEFWKQWYDTNSRVWSGLLGGDREIYTNPLGLYQQWFNALEGMNKQAEGGSAGVADPRQIQQQWMEATTEVWRRTAGLSEVMVGLAPRWVELAEALQKNVFDGDNFPTDPLDFYMRWYNATSGPLSKMAQDILESESYLEESRRFFDAYATLEGIFQRAAERYFSSLQLSTRADSTRVAKLVVGLEDKVDRIEEAFEEFEYGYARPATAETVEGLEDRIEDLERKLDDNRSDLRRVEDKLDRVLAVLDIDIDYGTRPVGPGENVEATARPGARPRSWASACKTSEAAGLGVGSRWMMSAGKERAR
jgi:hypothetical protein